MTSVAVIGCGPGGLAAVCALRGAGAMVTCFDIAATPGGIWNANSSARRDELATIHDQAPRNARGILSPVYPSMQCVLPKDLMAFDDQRFPFATPPFPHHSAVKRYLNDYASKKGVSSVTRFNTKVESVRYDAKEGCWRIVTVNVVTGDVFEWPFDNVVVATGQHHEPRFPRDVLDSPAVDPDGAADKSTVEMALKEFQDNGGFVGHAVDAKAVRQFKRKRVIVVGDGIGAYDYCRELRRIGADPIHSTLMDGTPFDSLGQDAMGGSSSAGRSVGFSVGSVASMVGRSFLSQGDSASHGGSELLQRWMRFRSSEALKIRRVGRIRGVDGRGIVCETYSAKKASSGPADSTEHMEMIDSVDAVVFCTGYELSFPFLAPEIREEVEARSAPLLLSGEGKAEESTEKSTESKMRVDHNRRGLFMGTLFAANPTLAFVGTQQELLPPFMMMQAQSRFVAFSMNGRYQLPTTSLYGLEGAAFEDQADKNRAALATREALYCEMMRGLGNGELYSTRGLGLNSVAYHDALVAALMDGGLDEESEEETATAVKSMHELTVGGIKLPTYSEQLLDRRWWALGSAVAGVYQRIRSWSPPKREKQHVLISNEI